VLAEAAMMDNLVLFPQPGQGLPDIEALIRHAATDPVLREAATVIWRRESPAILDPHGDRDGLRVSDVGQCVRKLWNVINTTQRDTFNADVQLFNLDDGTLGGCWWACLLAASLEAAGYQVELEPLVEHDGTPGHIDLFFDGRAIGMYAGVVEFKRTNWNGTLENPEHTKRYQVLQCMKYCAAKWVEDGAVVTVGPGARGKKVRVDWFKVGDFQHALMGEWMRLSAALGPVEPNGDPDAPFRCRGCFVTQCPKNPEYRPDVAAQLKASLK
jgi:hypothetical protein